MNMTLYSPVKDFDSFFDATFNKSLPPEKRFLGHNIPDDILEYDDRFEISIEVPGVSKDNISMEFKNGNLDVTAVRKISYDDKKVNKLASTRTYGEIHKSYRLSDSINWEDIEAETKDGILTIQLPKKAKAKAKNIKIK